MHLEHVAYHEAGHTLYIWLMWPGLRIASITIEPKGELLGQVRLPPRDPLQPTPTPSTEHARRTAKQLAASSLAGLAAEHIHFDEVQEGYEWGKARELLRAESPDPNVLGPLTGEVYGQALELLSAPPVWRGVERLAAALLEHGTLDNDYAWAFACGDGLPLRAAA